MSAHSSSSDSAATARMTAATRARLLARAQLDADQRGLPGAHGQMRIRKRGAYAPVIGGLALALAASLVFAFVAGRDSRLLHRQVAAEQIARRRSIDSLASIVEQKSSMIASLTGPSVQVMSLTASGARTARALMFWDTAKNRWTFVAHAMAPLPAGRTYQLWLVTAERKISAGTFGVTPAGDGLLEATYPLRASDLQAIAVTEEAEGGSPQPTSAPVIAVTAR